MPRVYGGFPGSPSWAAGSQSSSAAAVYSRSTTMPESVRRSCSAMTPSYGAPSTNSFLAPDRAGNGVFSRQERLEASVWPLEDDAQQRTASEGGVDCVEGREHAEGHRRRQAE